MSTETRTREDAQAEVARLRAGEDDTPRQPGTWRTPGRWIYDWNELPADLRLEWAQHALDNAQAAERCLLQDHAALRDELAAANDRIRSLLAVLDSQAAEAS